MDDTNEPKVVVLLGDIKQEKIDEIKELIGDKWDDRMLDFEAFEVQDPKYKATALRAELIGLIDKVLKGSSKELAKAEFGMLSEAEKAKVREGGKSFGHDCPNCDDLTCFMHPDYKEGGDETSH